MTSNHTAAALLGLLAITGAQATGQYLQVVGNGTCNIDGSLEDLQYVVLRP